MDALHEALRRVVAEIQPCSVRQAYYQATVRGIVEKTEGGYDRVQRALVKLRADRDIPYTAITDSTRWQIRDTGYDSLQDALDDTASYYRRRVWTDLDVRVEFWIEKDALAGVVAPITNKYDVPLMVARGFSSLSFLHSTACALTACGKPAYVYHLGDHDPSGVDAARNIERRLREFAPEIEIHFERLAVTPSQIDMWGLPWRPTKKSDSRAKKFGFQESTELDAIHPDVLRDLVGLAIQQHLPVGHLADVRAIESEERRALRAIASEGAR